MSGTRRRVEGRRWQKAGGILLAIAGSRRNCIEHQTHSHGALEQLSNGTEARGNSLHKPPVWPWGGRSMQGRAEGPTPPNDWGGGPGPQGGPASGPLKKKEKGQKEKKTE